MTRIPTSSTLIRGDDFIADWLEQRAKKVLSKSEAELCKRMAKGLRKSGRKKMVRVTEVPEKKT
jgi:hypothetical protein